MKSIFTIFCALSISFIPLQSEERSHAEKDLKNRPSFSWNRLPLYAHVRKKIAYTPEEIEYLATFPLLTFEKSNGHEDSGSTEAGTLKAARAVKAINPETKILYYRNVFVHYQGYAANQSLEGMRRAFLRGERGEANLVRGSVPAYDLSNRNLRKWWINAATEVCLDPAIDGIFLDGIVKVLEPSYLKLEIGEKKKAEVLQGYSDLLAGTRKALGPDQLIVGNILRARFPDAGLEAMADVDGSYIEGFEGAVRLSKKDYVAKGMAAFQKAARQGSLIAFTCKYGHNLQDADEAERSTEMKKEQADLDRSERAVYLISMFLVCAEKYSYFQLHGGYDALRSQTWMKHIPEYDRPLGAPKGPALRKGYTYSREFEYASVQLDIEKETAEILWRDPQ